MFSITCAVYMFDIKLTQELNTIKESKTIALFLKNFLFKIIWSSEVDIHKSVNMWSRTYRHAYELGIAILLMYTLVVYFRVVINRFNLFLSKTQRKLYNNYRLNKLGCRYSYEEQMCVKLCNQ